jgi:hypothetical protein
MNLEGKGGCTLLTRNTRDFEALEGMLAVEFYGNE